jgi:hypothetical protein
MFYSEMTHFTRCGMHEKGKFLREEHCNKVNDAYDLLTCSLFSTPWRGRYIRGCSAGIALAQNYT